MKRVAGMFGIAVLGIGAAMAQQDALKQAESTMKGNGKNAGALAAIVKGEKPYDQATVDTALAQFTETAKKLPTLFPDSIKGMQPDGDYQITPKVFEDKAGFAAKTADFDKAVTAAKASVKDLDTLKAAFPAIGKSCGGCHETFRAKKSRPALR